jgi:hypothetical protein
VKAISQAVNEHRIMAWSALPEEQEVLLGTPIGGVLPATNEDATTSGVFFRDTSTSKMDFYLETGATLSTDVCTAATPTFTTKVNLHSTVTEGLAESLPDYVASEYWGADQFRTEVYVYGPPGTSFVTAGVAEGADLLATTYDLGRPVAKFNVMLTPGQTSEITATFAGPEGAYGAPVLRTTPMLNPTTVAVDAPGCN